MFFSLAILTVDYFRGFDVMTGLGLRLTTYSRAGLLNDHSEVYLPADLDSLLHSTLNAVRNLTKCSNIALFGFFIERPCCVPRAHAGNCFQGIGQGLFERQWPGLVLFFEFEAAILAPFFLERDANLFVGDDNLTIRGLFSFNGSFGLRGNFHTPQLYLTRPRPANLHQKNRAQR